PHWILTALYILGIVPAVAGLDISDIGTAASALVLIMLILMLLVSLRLRYTMQSTFAHAPLRIPTGLHWTLTAVGTAVRACQIVRLAADFTPVAWLSRGVWLATVTLMPILRYPAVARVLNARSDHWPIRRADAEPRSMTDLPDRDPLPPKGPPDD